MAYSGQTLRIDCSKGGFTGMPNSGAIAPEQMVWPSRNINLHNGVREKRGGTALVYPAAFTDTPQIMGLYDFTMRGGTQFLMAATNDGKLYKNSTETIKTGLSVSNYFSFETAGNILFFTDRSGTVQTWDGSAASSSDIDHPAADWSTDPPLQLLRHGRGASQRLWAVNPSGLYASLGTDMQDFTGTGNVYISIDTGPGPGIVAAVEFGNRIIAFSKTLSYPINDTDTDIANWGYEKAIYSGGVAHWRLIAILPNDFVCMMDDGEIYSGTAVQSYGDYKVASITRPSWMHKWIQQNVRLSYIEKFHCTVDPVIRCIKFFVVLNGRTEADTALCYFYDRNPIEAWMIHDNPNVISVTSPSGWEDVTTDFTISEEEGSWDGSQWVPHFSESIFLDIIPGDWLLKSYKTIRFTFTLSDSIDVTFYADGLDPNLGETIYAVTSGQEIDISGYTGITLIVINSIEMYNVTKIEVYIEGSSSITSKSGYSASCSALVQKSAGNYKVYTGDHAGLIWELETANANDNGAAYYGGFKTPIMNGGDPRIDKKFDASRIICSPQGNYNLQASVFIDGKYETGGTFSMSGSGAVLGAFVLGTDTLGGTEIIEPDMDIGSLGKRLQLEVFNSGLNETFAISEVLIDLKALGAEQK